MTLDQALELAVSALHDRRRDDDWSEDHRADCEKAITILDTARGPLAVVSALSRDRPA